MKYRLALYNAIDGETAIPLIAFTQRKRINEDTLLETLTDLQIPQGYAETAITHSNDEIRLYENDVLKWIGGFDSIASGEDQAVINSKSTAAVPISKTVVIPRTQVAFIGNGYSRVRIPFQLDINPGDVVQTSYISLIARKTTARVSMFESFSEVGDNAAG